MYRRISNLTYSAPVPFTSQASPPAQIIPERNLDYCYTKAPGKRLFSAWLPPIRSLASTAAWLLGVIALVGSVVVLRAEAPVQEVRLTASDGVAFDEFGWSVTVSGNGSIAVVGAIADDNFRGAVYVYRRTDANWVETKLTANDGLAGDEFGWSVAISWDGNTVAVGAFGADSFRGSTYVYRWDGLHWIETKLTASDGMPGDEFGWAVALSGDGGTLVIGAVGDGLDQGSAYVYRRSGTQWVQTKKLIASDGVRGDTFGHAVAASSNGNAVVSGAFSANSFQGAAYVYQWDGAQWVQTKLVASDGSAGDQFGFSVGMSGDGNSVIAGAFGESSLRGAAYIFRRDNTQWLETKLTASDGAGGDTFGYWVGMSANGDAVIVSAIGCSKNQGAAYRFERKNLLWVESKVTDPLGQGEDLFGWSAALSADGNTALVGAFADDSARGSAHLYHWEPTIIVTATELAVFPVEGQYSDQATFRADVFPANAQGTVSFSVNGSPVGSATVANGVAEATTQILQGEGSYEIKAVFTSASLAFADAYGSSMLSVTREDAIVTPDTDNPSAVKASHPGGVAGPILFKARLVEQPDGPGQVAGSIDASGNICLAEPVTITLKPTGGGTTLSATGTIANCESGTLVVQATFDAVPVGYFEVNFSIGGSYFTGSASSTLAVYDFVAFPANGQYSDVVTLRASVSPATASGSVKFSVAGSVVGTATVKSGVAELPVQILGAAGTYPIKAVFTSSGPAFDEVDAVSSLTVSREDTAVLPDVNNPTAIKVASPGAGSEAFALKATIIELSNGPGQSSGTEAPGNICLAGPVTVTLTPASAGSPLTVPAVVIDCNGTTLSVQAFLSNVPVGLYSVAFNVGGTYYAGSATGVLAVCDPSLGFVTGGGKIKRSDGTEAEFAANAKYLKDGRLQGSVLYVEHRREGDLNITTDAIEMVLTEGDTAMILGKTTIAGVSCSLRAALVDKSEPGVGHDKFGLQITTSTGMSTLSFEPVTLIEGNIQVPQPQGAGP
jgi:FG-GAP repeat protein